LEDTKPYTTADFSVDLCPREIINPTNLNAVRIQRRQINVCGVYKKIPNSSILLVFNSQRIKEELDAWEELAGFLFDNKDPAGVVDMWDFLQEGDFDLNSVLKSGSTLFED
jgi:hypothetical protein